MEQTIQGFKNTWEYTRGMTISYIEALPEDKWEFSPDTKHGPLNKQFRHMVWVSGLYNHAVKTKTMDFSVKKSTYSGSLEKEDILNGLKDKDKELFEILDSIKNDGEGYKINAFDTEMGLSEYLHILLQHESLHHGMWSMYAGLGKFDVPKTWSDDWEL